MNSCWLPYWKYSLSMWSIGCLHGQNKSDFEISQCLIQRHWNPICPPCLLCTPILQNKTDQISIKRTETDRIRKKYLNNWESSIYFCSDTFKITCPNAGYVLHHHQPVLNVSLYEWGYLFLLKLVSLEFCLRNCWRNFWYYLPLGRK